MMNNPENTYIVPLGSLEGKFFGHYQVESEIGHGGMGIVYRAQDTRLKRSVALKIIGKPEGNSQHVSRLLHEAEAMAQLEHPNIVRIYEIGNRPSYYIAMEYVEGSDLNCLIKERKLKSLQATQILLKVVEALHLAHKHGIVHRDVKPSNIMVTKQGEPKLMDFGLAKVRDETIALSKSEGPESLSKSEDLLGTPAYMPPEQVEGRADKRSDIYAVGATLYEALTGCPPFTGENYWNILSQIVHKEPVPPRAINPDISPYLEAICLKCLKKSPHKRYQSARQLGKDLKNFLQHRPIVARPYTKLDKFKKTLQRYKVLLLTIVITSLLCALSGYNIFLINENELMQLQHQRAQRTMQEAQHDKKEAQRQLHEIQNKKALWQKAAQGMFAALNNIYLQNQQVRRIESVHQELTLVLTDLQGLNLERMEDQILLLQAMLISDEAKPRTAQDINEAIAKCSRILQTKPGHPEALKKRADLYLKLAQYALAEKDYTALVALFPKNAEIYYNRGLACYYQRKFELAEKDLGVTLTLQPDYFEARVCRGAVYQELKRYQKAIADYNYVIAKSPKYAEAYVRLAMVYQILHKYKPSEQNYAKAISLNKNNAQYYNNLAKLYMDTKNYAHAERRLNQAIALNPKYIMAYSNRATVYRMQKKYPQALQDYTKIIALNPRAADPYMQRGYTHYTIGQYNQAIADWQKAIQLAPAAHKPKIQKLIQNARQMLTNTKKK